MASTTLILGGGFGGIVTADRLRRLLPAEHKVVLVEMAPTFHIGATKTWVMLGEVKARRVKHSREALKKRGIDLVQTEVKGIDAARREVMTADRKLTADYLVVALGADLHMGAVEGLEEAAYSFYTLDEAVRLRDALKEFEGGDVLLLIPKAPFKCPPAPYEGALVLHDLFKKRGLLDKTSLSVYTVEGRPMATAGPEIGGFVIEELAARKIAFHAGMKTKGVNAGRRTVAFEDGSEARYDLLIAIPPHEAPKAVRESGLLNASGWVPVDPKTMQVTATDSGRAFAVGDVTAVPLPGRFKPDTPLALPKAGVFAEGHGKVVAANIAADVLGREASDQYDGKGFCYIETGDMHAVRGDGSFYELPHPVMRRKVPDMTQYEEKKAWVAGWVKKYL